MGNSSSRYADARQPKKGRSLNVQTSPLSRCSGFSYYRSYFCTTSYASRRKEHEKYTPGCRVSPALQTGTSEDVDGLHAIHTSRQRVDQTVLKKKHQHSTHRPPQTKVSGTYAVRNLATRQVLATPASSPSGTSEIVQLLTQATT